MRKLLTLLLFTISGLAFAGSHSVSQQVIFSGFPGNTKYENSYTTDYYGGGGGALVVLGASSSNIQASYPAIFPPVDPNGYSNQKFSSSCDTGINGYCYTYFTTNIRYNNKSCVIKITLKIDQDTCGTNPSSGCTTHSHEKSASGDCTISGDDLWIVKPKV